MTLVIRLNCNINNTKYLVFVNKITKFLVFDRLVAMLLKKSIFSGLGSSLEWFDFALYGFLGPIFAKIFFSHTSQAHWIPLLSTYAIFAIGFAARPIGALIFGYLGDKYGRLVPLRITPLLITFTTAIIAFLPTYKTIGNTAVVLLIIIRIIQGILLGGEFAGNIIYLCESSKKWRYFWGSIGSCTGSFGIILASIIASIFYSYFSYTFMYEYGWRIAFLLSVPLGIFAFIMRLNMSESPEFTNSNTHKNPVIEIFKKYKLMLLTCLGVIYLHATSFYFTFMFIPVFLTKVRHLKESAALIHNTGFLILHLCLIPIFGLIVNGIGGVRSLRYISMAFFILAIPSFYLISHGDKNSIIIGFLLLSTMTAINAAIIPGLLAELIPEKVRYTILASVFNIGFGIFGGITPVVCLLLTNDVNIKISPSIYLMLVAGVTLFTSYLLKTKLK